MSTPSRTMRKPRLLAGSDTGDLRLALLCFNEFFLTYEYLTNEWEPFLLRGWPLLIYLYKAHG